MVHKFLKCINLDGVLFNLGDFKDDMLEQGIPSPTLLESYFNSYICCHSVSWNYNWALYLSSGCADSIPIESRNLGLKGI